MVFTDVSVLEQMGKRNAAAISLTALITLLLLLLIQLPFSGKTPEEIFNDELGGVTVAMGWPDMGANNDMPNGESSEQSPNAAAVVPTPNSSNPSSSTVLTSEDDEVKYAREKAKEEQKQRMKEVDESIKKAQAEAETKTAEEKRLADIRAKSNGLKLKADGSGDNNKPGNGGNIKGSPNSDNLIGDGNGNGIGRQIGGGLGNRVCKGSNPISKDYNEKGTVMVRVCVDESGNVTSAVVQNQGTLTSSITLRNLAEQNARSYRFAAGDATCGTIKYVFSVK